MPKAINAKQKSEFAAGNGGSHQIPEKLLAINKQTNQQNNVNVMFKMEVENR
jgi:hypothetical protein